MNTRPSPITPTEASLLDSSCRYGEMVIFTVIGRNKEWLREVPRTTAQVKRHLLLVDPCSGYRDGWFRDALHRTLRGAGFFPASASEAGGLLEEDWYLRSAYDVRRSL